MTARSDGFTAQYDAAGNQTYRKLSGEEYALAYDAENRLVRTSGPSPTQFVYDGDGNLYKTIDARGSTWHIGNYYEWNDTAFGGFGTAQVSGLSFSGQARYGTSGSTGVPNAQLTLVKRQVCGGTTSDTMLSTLNSAGNGKFQLEYPYPACSSGCSCTVHLSIVPPQGYTPVSASALYPGVVISKTLITYPLTSTVNTSIYFNLSGSTPPSPAVIKRSYYQFSGRRLALRVSGSPVASENGVFFFMNDHLGGSNVTLKYVTGGLSKVGELRYKAWGESRAADYPDTATPTDLRFTGQRLYEGLGLYHYGARVYDPALGRFLSPDSLVPGRDAAAWDRYAYALENPVRYSDPTGHVAVEHAGFGGGCCSTRPQDKARYQRAYDYWYRLSNSNSHGAIREYYLTRAAQYVALMNQESENYETASIMSTVTLIRAILNGYRGTDAALETGLSAGAPLMIGFSSWSVSTVGIGYISTIGNSPYGNSAPMSVIRTIQRGESVANILDELKSLTFASDSEYAVVRLADGTRAIVSGGRGGIDLSPNVNRIIIHTHPYSISATGPSDVDINALSALNQVSSYLLEHGILIKFWR